MSRRESPWPGLSAARSPQRARGGGAGRPPPPALHGRWAVRAWAGSSPLGPHPAEDTLFA